MKSRKPIAVTVAILLMLGAVLGFTSNPATATPPTTDTFRSAEFGAQWLITQADPSGAIGGSTATSSVYNSTAQAAYSLALANQGEDTFDAAVTWLEDNADDRAAIAAKNDPGFVGLLGTLLLVAEKAGIDPNNFGGVDLEDTLDQTLQVSGLYGDTDATYDGVYRQSLAILGLETNGLDVPADAIDWLVDQQCGASPSAATGGWQSYRADTSVACSAPDANSFSGPDTNSTALAILALVEVGAEPNFDPFDYLETVQDPDSGGFAYWNGPGVDANSTALVLMAITAADEDPTSAPWQRTNGNPVTSLLSWQIGCGDPTAVGAFQASWTPGPNLFATIQSVWAMALAEGPDLQTSFNARSTFVDVCEDNNSFFWEITSVANWRIATGYPDGTFLPSNTATREAMAAFMYRSKGSPSFTPSGQTFSDVPASSTFYKEIEWAADAGIVEGYSDGTFRPQAGASREAVAAFFYRRTGSPSFTPSGQTFSDVPASSTFYKEIEWAADWNIVEGYDDGTFQPLGLASREAVMAFFYRWD